MKVKNGNNKNEVVRKHYNKVVSNYDENYNSNTHKAEDKMIIDIIKRYNKKNILDIGCGTGLFLEYNKLESLDSYLGIDIADMMLEKAKMKHPKAKFLLNDMHNISVEDNTFDMVICMYGVCSYTMYFEKLIKEIKRVLQPGGIILLMPYSYRVKNGIALGKCMTLRSEDLQISYFKPYMLDIISKKGFEILEVSGLNYLGNIFNILINFFNKFGFNIREVGTSYIKKEYMIFRILMKIFGVRMVNLARHTLIIAELKF